MAGIQRQLADFWDGWDDVANKPDSLAARSQLIERAQTLADGLNGAVDKLDAQYDATHSQLTATVHDINAVAAGRRRLQPRHRLRHARRPVAERPARQATSSSSGLGELGRRHRFKSGEAGLGSTSRSGDTALVTGTATSLLKVDGRRRHSREERALAVVWPDPPDADDT
jgi:flagellar hook-associated protein 1 FlgK